jgi:hypothetical protein
MADAADFRGDPIPRSYVDATPLEAPARENEVLAALQATGAANRSAAFQSAGNRSEALRRDRIVGTFRIDIDAARRAGTRLVGSLYRIPAAVPMRCGSDCIQISIPVGHAAANSI